ncbi:MAG: hypothetical protein SFX73_40910 [Kofleriaceae bacterium]|nr:hypothetical protein [Kofleriaceae bacterium]
MSDEILLKTGAFLYDGIVRCPVRVVQTEFLPGSGDHEDPPEIADDQPGTWFRVDLTGAGEPTRWSSSIVGFKTLDEAIAHCESLAIVWDE